MDTTKTAAPPEAEQDIFAMFETDTEAEKMGIWVPFATSRFRIRAAGAPEVQKVREAQQKRQAKLTLANNGALPPDIVERNEVEMVCALVTDWEGVPDPDRKGATMPCTDDNRRRLFSRPGMRNFRNRIWAVALDTDSYRKAALEAVEGNSSPASNGNSPTAPTPQA